MSDRINLLVSGARACFRRPEFSDDFVTYDVMPPLAARRVLATAFLGINLKTNLAAITVLNPISFTWGALNTSRGSKRVLLLRDVSYIIHAEIMNRRDAQDLIGPEGIELAPRAAPHLGLTDFPASLSLIQDERSVTYGMTDTGTVDLGWMPFDIADSRQKFRRLAMRDGKIELASRDDEMEAT